MCVTMIDPATSWFEIVELPISKPQQLDIPSVDKKGKKVKRHNMTMTTSLKKTILTSHLRQLAL
jgi:hypothetical protein